MTFSPFGVALALTKVAISCYVAVLNSAALQKDKNPFPVQFSCLKVSWAAASLVYMLVKDALLEKQLNVLFLEVWEDGKVVFRLPRHLRSSFWLWCSFGAFRL